MIIGVPGEIKENEYRVGITVAGVNSLKDAGHQVLVQKGAGEGSGISDQAYQAAGAELVADAEEIYARSDLIIKIKEPLPEEYDYLKKEQIIFTYLHLAANEELVNVLLNKGVTAIAYETVQLKDGSLTLLIPMSEVAGRLSIQAGAYFLEKPQGGSGVLLGGVPGSSRLKLSSWAAVMWVSMQPVWLSGWGQKSPSWTSVLPVSGTWMKFSTAG